MNICCIKKQIRQAVLRNYCSVKSGKIRFRGVSSRTATLARLSLFRYKCFIVHNHYVIKHQWGRKSYFGYYLFIT